MKRYNNNNSDELTISAGASYAYKLPSIRAKTKFLGKTIFEVCKGDQREKERGRQKEKRTHIVLISIIMQIQSFKKA